jgi:hypothetical protein
VQHVAMRIVHALGTPGGARRIEHVRRGVERTFLPGMPCRRCRVERERYSVDHRRRAAQRTCEFLMLGGGHDRARRKVVHLIAEHRGRQALIQRRIRPKRLEDRECPDDGRVALRQQQCDRSGRCRPRVQDRRGAIRVPVQRRVADVAARQHNRRRVGTPGRLLLEAPVQRRRPAGQAERHERRRPPNPRACALVVHGVRTSSRISNPHPASSRGYANPPSTRNGLSTIASIQSNDSAPAPLGIVHRSGTS